jgi:signal peptidase I
MPDRSRPSADQVLAALSAPAGSNGHPPAAADVPHRTTGPAPARRQEEGSIKETVESILVAFVLAFIFRAFVVEAFVIPTGSMAPTLLGAHMRFTCQDCGYRFDVNYTGRTIGDDVEIPTIARNSTYALNCPNCGLKVPRQNGRDPEDENDATAPPVHYGDRILVLKYAYLLSQPRRWDVVVFKTPDRAEDERRQVVPPYTINYIKRLVGRPGESIYVLDGDVYVGSADADLKDYQVQPKPRPAQEALWRVVYDNDYQPSRPDWHEPWAEVTPGSGWKAGAPGNPDSGVMPARVLRFENASGAGVLQFQPEGNAGNQPLTDWLAYAATKHAGSGDSYDSRGLVARNNVSDLKLSLFYERHAGDGPLRLQLSKLEQTFTAEFTPGRVRLLRERDGGGGPEELASAALPAGSSHPLHVEFMNVDYRVTVRVDGRDLIQTTPPQYHPDMAFLLQAWERDQMLPKPQVRIGAERQSCDLAHVSLWRDVYYTNRDESFASELKWGIPSRPIKLGPDEYWVLGDNSLMSGDGRYWGQWVDLPGEGLHTQPGVVPGRFLLGKAFFVYWPAGYRLSPGSPGMVPNFGDMRFIH